MSVATPALPCDGHVETKLDAGCEWSRQIKASVNLTGIIWRPVSRRLSPKSVVTEDFLS